MSELGLNSIQQTIITFIALKAALLPARLVTLSESIMVVIKDKNSRTPFLRHGYPIVRIKNALHRGSEMRCEESRGEKYGVGRCSFVTVFPWQHYAVYDRSIAKRPPCDEGHDPRYDLVKKPFNVSTSQRLHCDFIRETPRRDAKTFIIIVPSRLRFDRSLQIVSEQFRPIAMRIILS